MIDKRGREIRKMFASIAPRYDLLNRVLSLWVDQYWRRVVKKKLALKAGETRLVLDLCTGTGDLAFTLGTTARVIGGDFCHPGLVQGLEKKQKIRDRSVCFVEGDALNLPFPSNRFEAVTIAFGLRNLEHYARGIREMARVTRPGGSLAVLEFSIPRLPLFRQLYLFYFTRLLPKIGRLISGKEGPYSYLPASVRTFPAPAELGLEFKKAGFVEVEITSLTGGIATLYLAKLGDEKSAKVGQSPFGTTPSTSNPSKNLGSRSRRVQN